MGLSVTVCIAAMCLNCIVTVSDRRLTYSDLIEAPDDATLKAFKLPGDWGLLFAASDLSPVQMLVEDIRARLKPLKDSLTAKTVQEHVREAYRAAHQNQVVDHILGRYGLKSVEDFRRNGFAEFGFEIFSQLVERIEKFDLGVSLLVYGFNDGPQHISNIFAVENPGVIIDHQLEGFGVIGSGSWPALASMTFRGVTGLGSLSEAVYRLCEAKFRAETASGVGRATTVMIFAHDGRMHQLPPGIIDKLREIWDLESKVPVSEEVFSVLGDRRKHLIFDD